MWNCPFQRPAKSLSYMENTSRLKGNRTTSEFLQTKIALMSGYDLSVFWPSSLSVRLSLLNSHTKTKLMFESKQPSRTTSFTADEREGGKTQKFNNCVEPSVFIIPSLLSNGNDLLVTKSCRPQLRSLWWAISSFKQCEFQFSWPNAL